MLSGLSKAAKKFGTPSTGGQRAMRLGSNGMDVARCQNLLNEHLSSMPPPLWVDGMFGPKTDAKVKTFQMRNGLAVDGIVGPATKAKLEKRS